MKKTQQRIIPAIALLMIACVTAGIFVSCGGEPSSSGTSGKQSNAYAEWEDPPVFEPIEYYTYEIPDVILKEDPQKTNPSGSSSTKGYAASSESNRYHYPSCYYVDNILPENLIYFSSKYSARQAGYYPCSVCNP